MYAILLLIVVLALWAYVSVQIRNGKRRKLTEEYIKLNGSICQECKKNIPILYRKFSKTLTIIAFMWRKQYEGVICDECTTKIGTSHISYTVFLGWPGIFIVVSIIDIIEDILEMRTRKDTYLVAPELNKPINDFDKDIQTAKHVFNNPHPPVPAVAIKNKNITSCPNCGKPLGATQIDKMKNIPDLTDWYREGYCSLSCFKVATNRT